MTMSRRLLPLFPCALLLTIAAVPESSGAALQVVLPFDGRAECVCKETSTVDAAHFATDIVGGNLVVVASHTPGIINSVDGRCVMLGCSKRGKDCEASVDVRVAVHHMGTYPGNVFWAAGTNGAAAPLSVGQSVPVTLRVVTECGRCGSVATELLPMDPQTGGIAAPPIPALLSTELRSDCGNCTGPR